MSQRKKAVANCYRLLKRVRDFAQIKGNGTIEDVYEPYLLQIGFLNRTPRGRMATVKAYEHFKIPYTTELRFDV